MYINKIGPQDSFRASATIVNEVGRRTQEVSAQQLTQARTVISKTDVPLTDVIRMLLKTLDIKVSPASNRLYLDVSSSGISFGDISAKGAEGTTAAFGGFNVFVG